jgi:2'-5' RNA ligase
MRRSLQAATGSMGENLFYAIMPDVVVGRMIHRRAIASRRKYGFSGAAIPPERLHVSLHGLGYFESAPPPAIIEAACTIGASMTFPSFSVTFDNALSFQHPKSRPYVLTGGAGLDPLRMFHAKLGDALTGVRIKISRSFTPHLTLLYDAEQIPPHAISPVSWMVSELVLVRSFVGQSRYEIAGRWQLS